LHTIWNAKRMDTEQHEAYTMTENFPYPANLDLQLDTLSTPYVSQDNAVSFGYEYIDKKESSPNMLTLNIPANIKSTNVLNKNAPSEDALFKVVNDILPTIRHRESQLTEQMTQAFYK